MDYNFPVTNKFLARDVTSPNFDIVPHQKDLYATINPYRYDSADDSLRNENLFLEGLNFELGIDKDVLSGALSDTYYKTLFSGHKGSGKTLELNRYNQYLNHPDRYFTIFVEIEKEFGEISNFQPEDFYVLMVIQLIETLEKNKLKFESKELNSIAREWLSDKEITNEIKISDKIDVGTEAGVGFNFLDLLKLKTGIKSLFTYSSTSSERIRETVRNNAPELVDRLNIVFRELRNEITNANKGKDIIFIFDGTEKIALPVYEKIFVRDYYIINGLFTNMICSIPIESFYKIDFSASQGLYNTTILPMVNLGGTNAKKAYLAMESIISKRMHNNTFYNEAAIQLAVKLSGGCPRQLLEIVHKSLSANRGAKLNEKVVAKTCQKIGIQKRGTLTTEKVNILKTGIKSGKFELGDQHVREMLLELVLFKYNGKVQLNPLLEGLL